MKLSFQIHRDFCRGLSLRIAKLLAGSMTLQFCLGASVFASGVVTNFTDASNLLAALDGGGLVSFSGSGTIVLTNTITIVTNTVVDATGFDVTINSGASVPVRLFLISSNVTTTLLNLKLSNGRSTNGGAICNLGSLVASNCSFSGNSAIGSNGIAGLDGASDSSVGHDGGSGSSGATALGGAICNVGSLSLTLCTFQNNAATGGNGGAGGNGGNGGFRGGDGGLGGGGGAASGGAIYSVGNISMAYCTFSSNSVTAGDGVKGGAGGSSDFVGRAGSGGTGGPGAGAGVYCSGGSSVMSCTFNDNTIKGGNSAAAGTRHDGNGFNGTSGGDARGGAFCNIGANTVINSTFSQNKVTAGSGGNGGAGDFISGDGGNGGLAAGGALYNSGKMHVTNCTLTLGNAIGGTKGIAGAAPFPGSDGSVGASQGGNLANLGAAFELKNSIASGSLGGGNGYGAIVDAGFNISSDGSLALAGSGSLQNTDPRLDTLGDNGGPTKTIALHTNSPAIDAGDGLFCLSFDQRMVPRPVGPRCDIGAFEFGAEPNSPLITSPPASVSVNTGQPAGFAVTASGDPPLSYEWRFNGSAISGATTSSYTNQSVVSSNAGGYQVVVMNFFGSVTSTVATLTVYIPPTIIRQPVSQIVTQGNSVTFSVLATGSPAPAYQWYFNDSNVLAGATSAFLTLPSIQPGQAGAYSVKIVNAGGAAFSQAATLKVLSPPTITSPPVAQSVEPGSPATFSVLATGDAPLSYQWFLNLTTPIAGATGPTLLLSNVQPSDSGNYSVTISNSVGATSSAPVALSLLPTIPVIKTQPQSRTNNTGTIAQFTVVADGEAPLFYQWRHNNGNIPGANAATYTINNVQTNDAGAYDVIVANDDGSTPSAPAILTVLARPVIIEQPQSLTNFVGGIATFSIAVSGTPPLTYHWNFNGANLASGTNATLTISNLQASDGGSYYVAVVNDAGLDVSSTATLTVLPLPMITNVRTEGGDFLFDFPTVNGVSYVTECSPALTVLNWTPVTTNLGTGGVLTNRLLLSTNSSQVYRLRVQ